MTKPDSERAADPKDICQRLQTKGIKSIAITDNDKAFENFINSDAEVLVNAGSLYLIGYIRECIIATCAANPFVSEDGD